EVVHVVAQAVGAVVTTVEVVGGHVMRLGVVEGVLPVDDTAGGGMGRGENSGVKRIGFFCRRQKALEPVTTLAQVSALHPEAPDRRREAESHLPLTVLERPPLGGTQAVVLVGPA